MTETQPQSETFNQVPAAAPSSNTVTLRIPKPNTQVVVLGLIAFITLFQTFQLVRMSGKASAAPAKVAPSATSAPSASHGTGSGADVPQSMVGGC